MVTTRRLALFALLLVPGSAAAQNNLIVTYNHSPDHPDGARFRLSNPERETPWVRELPPLTLNGQDSVCVHVVEPNVLLYSYAVTNDSLAVESDLDAEFLTGLLAGIRSVSGLTVSGPSLPASPQTAADATELRNQLSQLLFAPQALVAPGMTPPAPVTAAEVASRYLDGTLNARAFRSATAAASPTVQESMYDQLYLLALGQMLLQAGHAGTALGSDPENFAAWRVLERSVRSRASEAKVLVNRVDAVKADDPRAGQSNVDALVAQIASLAEEVHNASRTLASAQQTAIAGIRLCSAAPSAPSTRFTISPARKKKVDDRASDPRATKQTFLVERDMTTAWKLVPLVFGNAYFSGRQEVVVEDGAIATSDASSDVVATIGVALFLRLVGPLGGVVGLSSVNPDDEFPSLHAGLALSIPLPVEVTFGAGLSWANVVTGAKDPGTGADVDPKKLEDVLERARRFGFSFFIGVAGLGLGGS